MLTPLSYVNKTRWDFGADDPLWLLTPTELNAVPADTILTSITGDKRAAGGITDRDTRFGYTAYGLLESQFKAPDGYEFAETSAAKDHVHNAIEEELERQGIDPYSERADQSSPDLIDLADAVVERLLKEGVIIPETIRNLHG